MKKVLALYFLISFTFIGILIAADTPEELYKKGNSSYENEDYGKAASIYEKLGLRSRLELYIFCSKFLKYLDRP